VPYIAILVGLPLLSRGAGAEQPHHPPLPPPLSDASSLIHPTPPDAISVQHCSAFLEAVRIRITEGYPCFPVPSPVCLID
jgi:hypothetical protein